MSGGSFDFLSTRLDSVGVLGTPDEYARMAASLLQDGHEQAAALTTILVAHLRDAEQLARLLSEVHHAQEWRVSGDSSVERVRDASRKLHDKLEQIGFGSEPYGNGSDETPTSS